MTRFNIRIPYNQTWVFYDLENNQLFLIKDHAVCDTISYPQNGTRYQTSTIEKIGVL